MHKGDICKDVEMPINCGGQVSFSGLVQFEMRLCPECLGRACTDITTGELFCVESMEHLDGTIDAMPPEGQALIVDRGQVDG